MFDPISMGAMGALGVGTSLLSGFLGSNAASNAQAGQLGYLDQALQGSKTAGMTATNLFSPYQLYGSGALSFLQSRILSGNERQMASAQQRTALQSEVDRLSQATDWNSMPILTGEKASERRASLFYQMEADRKAQLQAAQSKLNAYEKEQSALAPFQKEQDAQLQATQGRITSALDLVSQASNFNLPTSMKQLRQDLTNDPVFQFRREQGERAINRAAAARGNFLSGAALASIGDFNQQLTADETDRYLNRLITSKTASLQGAVTGLGALTGANQQDISNLMGLSQMGLNAASGASQAITATNGVNANLQGQMGQTMANTEMAKGQAWQQAIGGISQMAGMGMGLSMMSGLMRANVAAPGTASAVNSTGLTAFNSNGTDFLVNKPR